MILNVVLQIVIGAVVDLMILCFLVGFEKEPVLAVGHINYKGWTIYTSAVMFFACSYMVATVLNELVGREPGYHRANWVFRTTAFEDRYEEISANLTALNMTW